MEKGVEQVEVELELEVELEDLEKEKIVLFALIPYHH
jgi:hypothetical protein